MARIAKTAAAAPAASKAVAAPAAGKVAKLDKTAKAAKPEKVAKPAAETAPRGQYAVGKLKVTAAGKAATLRGGRAVRLALVQSLDGKPMSEVLGAAYTLDGETEARTLNSGNIAVFVDKEFIEIV